MIKLLETKLRTEGDLQVVHCTGKIGDMGYSLRVFRVKGFHVFDFYGNRKKKKVLDILL
jgi:hypothetical protein